MLHLDFCRVGAVRNLSRSNRLIEQISHVFKQRYLQLKDLHFRRRLADVPDVNPHPRVHREAREYRESFLVVLENLREMVFRNTKKISRPNLDEFATGREESFHLIETADYAVMLNGTLKSLLKLFSPRSQLRSRNGLYRYLGGIY